MRLVRFALTPALLVALSGCGLLGIDGDDDGVFFIAQRGTPDGVMQALYQGRVVARGECLRLADQPDGHTVVWPHGFALGGPGGEYVLNDRGKIIGRIGGNFKLGGGEVPTLWENGPVTEQVRQRALSACPGRYWLVGEVG